MVAPAPRSRPDRLDSFGFTASGADAVGGAGNDSSGALLLTMLGEFMLPNAGTAWTSTLVDAFGELGVEQGAARQAIARSAQAGWLANEKIGRRARWHLTSAARRLLNDGTQRIYGFGRSTAVWDGRWLLLLVTVPESQRDLRYRLRVRLGWVGLAPIGGGCWISPWVEREGEVAAVVDELGLDGTARSFIGCVGRLGDPVSLVADAWDLTTVGAAYDTFVARHSQAEVAPVSAFGSMVRLVHEWRRFPGFDPDLPPSLLPKRWSGRDAVALFHRRHAELAGPAQTWWRDHEAAADTRPSHR